MSGSDFQAARRWPGIIRWLLGVVLAIATTALQHILVSQRSSQKLAAENLFLRKQLALFKEREIKPRRADDVTRAALVWLFPAFNWHDALVIVKPATLIRWHREGFRRYWKLKSRPGRPALPRDVRAVPGSELPTELQSKRHELPTGACVTVQPVLGGLHHEYSWQLAA